MKFDKSIASLQPALFTFDDIELKALDISGFEIDVP